jgi:RimJ/RimL family protein N-acetyltransferase
VAQLVIQAYNRDWHRRSAFNSLDRATREHDVFNTIKTARLILRPWHVDDLEELERLFADPDVRIGRNLQALERTEHKDMSLIERERSKL